MANCLVCKQPLPCCGGEYTVVRKAIRPPRAYKRWIELGGVHEECENKIEINQDVWNNPIIKK